MMWYYVTWMVIGGAPRHDFPHLFPQICGDPKQSWVKADGPILFHGLKQAKQVAEFWGVENKKTEQKNPVAGAPNNEYDVEGVPKSAYHAKMYPKCEFHNTGHYPREWGDGKCINQWHQVDFTCVHDYEEMRANGTLSSDKEKPAHVLAVKEMSLAEGQAFTKAQLAADPRGEEAKLQWAQRHWGLGGRGTKMSVVM